jgi:hypothetical protein
MLPPQDMDMESLRDTADMFRTYLIPALVLAPLLLCVGLVICEVARKTISRMHNKVQYFDSDDAPRNRRRAEMMTPCAPRSSRKGRR